MTPDHAVVQAALDTRDWCRRRLALGHTITEDRLASHILSTSHARFSLTDRTYIFDQCLPVAKGERR